MNGLVKNHNLPQILSDRAALILYIQQTVFNSYRRG